MVPKYEPILLFTIYSAVPPKKTVIFSEVRLFKRISKGNFVYTEMSHFRTQPSHFQTNAPLLYATVTIRELGDKYT